jgi:hypothetical protein
MRRLEDVDLGGAAAFVVGWAWVVFARTCACAGGDEESMGLSVGWECAEVSNGTHDRYCPDNTDSWKLYFSFDMPEWSAASEPDSSFSV